MLKKAAWLREHDFYVCVMPEIPPETKFSVEIPGIPIPLIGYLDLMVQDGPVLDVKTVGSRTASIKTSWQVQARTYSYVTGRDVEYHTISRAKEPRIVTALESEGLLLRHSSHYDAMLFHQLQQTAGQINHLFATLGPDQVWPANFASDACGWCGFKPQCAYWSV